MAWPSSPQCDGRRRRTDAGAGRARRQLRLSLHAARQRAVRLSARRRDLRGRTARPRPLWRAHRRRGQSAESRTAIFWPSSPTGGSTKRAQSSRISAPRHVRGAGRIGPMVTVNAAPAPLGQTLAPGARIRLRLINSTAARIMSLSIEGAEAVDPRHRRPAGRHRLRACAWDFSGRSRRAFRSDVRSSARDGRRGAPCPEWRAGPPADYLHDGGRGAPAPAGDRLARRQSLTAHRDPAAGRQTDRTRDRARQGRAGASPGWAARCSGPSTARPRRPFPASRCFRSSAVRR